MRQALARYLAKLPLPLILSNTASDALHQQSEEATICSAGVGERGQAQTTPAPRRHPEQPKDNPARSRSSSERSPKSPTSDRSCRTLCTPSEPEVGQGVHLTSTSSPGAQKRATTKAARVQTTLPSDAVMTNVLNGTSKPPQPLGAKLPTALTSDVPFNWLQVNQIH